MEELHEVYIYHHATCVWIKYWVPKSYNPDPPPPGAPLRDWGSKDR